MFDLTSVNATDTTSAEDPDLLNDRINLIAATTLIGVTYGIMFTLYCITVYHLLNKLSRESGSHPRSPLGNTDWHKPVFYIAYTTILFLLGTLYTACNSQNAITAYVDNRTYPGGPYLYYVTYMAGQRVMVMTDVTSFIMFWMTDGLILCRFIMFYYKTPYARWIIPLPCAMFVGVIVLSTLVLRGEAQLGKIFYLSEDMMLAYYTLSFSLNVLATLLIAARLYWHKIRLERIFGRSIGSPYMSIATMLIESAALYGAWSLVFLILCILKSPAQTIILATMSQIQVIAPLLIILWMARGKAFQQSKYVSEEDGIADSARIPTDPQRIQFVSESKCGVEGVSVETNQRKDQNASWSFIDGHHDDDVIELGLGASKPSSIMVVADFNA